MHVQNVINQFTRIGQDDRVRFMGNVNVGQDITLHELRQFYSAVRSPKKHHWVSVVIAFVCRKGCFCRISAILLHQAADDASIKELQMLGR